MVQEAGRFQWVSPIPKPHKSGESPFGVQPSSRCSFAEKQGDGSKTAAACVRQGFAGDKSPPPHLWHGGDVCIGGRTKNNKEDEGTERRDPKGPTELCPGTSLHPCSENLSRVLWGILSTDQVRRGGISFRLIQG